MNTANKLSYNWIFIGLLITTVVLFFTDVLVGSVSVPFTDVWVAITESAIANKANYYIINEIRIPKALTAIIAGAALSISGLLMQTLFRNPLASPTELGISAGASLGIGILIFTNLIGISSISVMQQLGISSSWLMIVMATLGSSVVFSLIILIANKIKDNVVLLIAGVMIGTITLSLTSVWQYFAQPEQLKSFLIWTFGSLGNATKDHLLVLYMVVGATLLLTFLLSKSLNTLLLGEAYAESLGISIKRTRLLVLLCTCILTGAVTAFCGPIGFIGIAVPHLTRTLVKTADHRKIIPICGLIGACVLLLCDIISQIPGTQFTLPINIVTSLIGAPIVLWIIIQMNNLGRNY